MFRGFFREGRSMVTLVDGGSPLPLTLQIMLCFQIGSKDCLSLAFAMTVAEKADLELLIVN